MDQELLNPLLERNLVLIPKFYVIWVRINLNLTLILTGSSTHLTLHTLQPVDKLVTMETRLIVAATFTTSQYLSAVINMWPNWGVYLIEIKFPSVSVNSALINYYPHQNSDKFTLRRWRWDPKEFLHNHCIFWSPENNFICHERHNSKTPNVCPAEK